MASEGGDRVPARQVAGDKILELLFVFKGCVVDYAPLEGMASGSVVRDVFLGGSNSLWNKVHVAIDGMVRF